MQENENIEIENNEGNQMYIDAINELKANTVDKAAYDKLASDNKRLLNSLLNNQTISQEAQSSKESVASLRQKLFKEDLSNLEFVKTALNLREALMEEGEPDPFTPQGHKVITEQSDVEAAQRVADVLQQCVEYSEGDSEVFTNELQRRTVDTQIKKPKK